MVDAAKLRQEYRKGQLLESDVPRDPVELFETWIRDAVAAQLPEPHAMTLATADKETGQASSRIVLLRGSGPQGFVFYTNYESRKGKELRNNPKASLTFFWAALERQVRVEGTAALLDADASDAYFASRPRESQLGAWASNQSAVLDSRSTLDRDFAIMEQRFEGLSIPRPGTWGGFALAPENIEFWQGRPGRLHDRLRYRRKKDGSWLLERLSP